KRTLIYCVYIVHVQVDRRGHRFPTPGTTAANHHHRVANPDLRVDTAGGPRRPHELCRSKCLFHDIVLTKKPLVLELRIYWQGSILLPCFAFLTEKRKMNSIPGKKRLCRQNERHDPHTRRR